MYSTFRKLHDQFSTGSPAMTILAVPKTHCEAPPGFGHLPAQGIRGGKGPEGSGKGPQGGHCGARVELPTAPLQKRCVSLCFCTPPPPDLPLGASPPLVLILKTVGARIGGRPGSGLRGGLPALGWYPRLTKANLEITLAVVCAYLIICKFSRKRKRMRTGRHLLRASPL